MDDSYYRDVYWMLRNTSKHLKSELQKKIENYGITWPQFHALYHIKEEGISFNELAKEIHCNASNMTGLIDRMGENGWVYREQSVEDRRVWLVKLTEEGNRLKTTLLPKHKKNINQCMGVLNEEEIMTLKKILDKLMKGNEGE